MLKELFSITKRLLKDQRGFAIVTKQYTFSAGAVIVASEHNANADAIFNDYNGNITNANLSASAGIVDTKLAQITTAGKVSGAALTLLANTPEAAGLIPSRIMIVQDQKTSGTAGGTFTAGLQTRDLTTVQHNTITGASLASNQITLPAGTYLVEASAPAAYVNIHLIILQNITDTSTDIIGSGAFASHDYYGYSRSFLMDVITITGTKVFEIQHSGQTTRATDGFGISVGGVVEVYTMVKIVKL